MLVTFQRKHQLTPRMTTYWFSKPTGFRFTPGEYIEAYLPHNSADNRGEHRKFSISSAPHEPLLGLTVRIPASYPSSFKQALAKLQPGDTLGISEPIGDFVLPKLETLGVTGVALGSGITPFMSMTSHLAHLNSRRPFRLFQAVTAFEDIIDLPMPTTPILPKPNSSWTGLSGRITAHDIIDDVAKDATLFYLSGPDHSVQMLRQGLLDEGILPINIVSDPFLGSQE